MAVIFSAVILNAIVYLCCLCIYLGGSIIIILNTRRFLFIITKKKKVSPHDESRNVSVQTYTKQAFPTWSKKVLKKLLAVSCPSLYFTLFSCHWGIKISQLDML